MIYDTFEHEENVPKLPVPTLTLTVQQLLEVLEPLLSSEEYAEVFREATSFMSNKTVLTAQKHLESIYKLDPELTNYLNFVNGETAPGIYGELKNDILPRNPYLILEEDPYSKTLHPPSQAERSASLINSTLKFIITLRNKTLKPDVTPKNQTPLSMKCYYNLFGTSRIPDESPDASSLGRHVTMKKYTNMDDSRHIVFLCNNQFFLLEVLTPLTKEEDAKSKHKIWFLDVELAEIIDQIILEASNISPIDAIKKSLGALTTQSYSNWKLARSELKLSNPEHLKAIDDALFIIVLDHNTPKNDSEKTRVVAHGSSELTSSNIQCGSCTLRWYDKLQLVVTKNSVAGISWESSIMDLTAILRFISDIYTDSLLKLAKNINGSEYTLFDDNIEFVLANADKGGVKPKPVAMIFNMTPTLLQLVHLSETRLTDLINQHEYETLDLKLQTHIIKKFNITIDSLLQLAFQIANYSLYGQLVNTLEPITTRRFRDSRTELIGVQSQQVSNLVKTFLTNSNSSVKWELFKECCAAHTQKYHDAMMGKGFHRHFMALRTLLRREAAMKYLNEKNSHLTPIPTNVEENYSVPLLFNPYILDKLTSPEMLISNCGNNALRLFGFPPAVDNGFAVGYIIHNDRVFVSLCSKYRQTHRFTQTFKSVIHELTNLVRAKSNFMIDINDTESRKIELKKLAIQRELQFIDKDVPSTRHPIELTIGGAGTGGATTGGNETPVLLHYDPSVDHFDPSDYASVAAEAFQKMSHMATLMSQTSTLNHQLSEDDEPTTTAAAATATATGITTKSQTEPRRNRRRSSGDYDLLGGYGYFDFGELDIRSNELSRTQSYVGSVSNIHSGLGSRRHSQTNLRQLASSPLSTLGPNLVDIRLLMTDRIKDQLSGDQQQREAKPKNEIGTKLNVVL
ncbi:uncharacterized protein KQ657_004200 [Scheffersomyces spartinae]|uniref:Choline/carnitine acyltransferase domain-containing protein n=1 Tax=Scheffersomyces spartinae TaxID=45513 RepID=A0A9P7VD19_9ASCO|nr:uncharacterized protein KQ657_004200 [Scheffersomyces spartinae]KAG7195084.1 hypothetical protein KQ657_004200 [Scheffersomyces spartinae]